MSRRLRDADARLDGASVGRERLSVQRNSRGSSSEVGGFSPGFSLRRSCGA